jgi:hypothetical protein
VDVYFLWQILLILIGVVPLSGLIKTKAWAATAVSVVILMVLATVPHIVSSALSGLTMSGFYF